MIAGRFRETHSVISARSSWLKDASTVWTFSVNPRDRAFSAARRRYVSSSLGKLPGAPRMTSCRSPRWSSERPTVKVWRSSFRDSSTRATIASTCSGMMRVRRHRHVRRVVAAVEEPRDLGKVAVERRLAAREHDRVEGAEVGERAVVLLELHLEVPVDVQVVPVEARHALRVAEVRHPEDQVARQRVPAPQPVGGELEVVHRAAVAKTPRPMPARRPARYVRWWTANANGTAGKSARSRRQIGNESAQVRTA